MNNRTLIVFVFMLGMVAGISLFHFSNQPVPSVVSSPPSPPAAPQHPAGAGYWVTVDYGMTVEKMVGAGHYDWKSSDINSRNFPVKGEGTIETKLELVHLNKAASTEEVEAYFEENGLRAATLEELLAFGVTYPDVQREFPVVALGSSWVDPDGNRTVPYLFWNGSGRYLNLLWRGGDWDGYCRFLAVRK